MTQISLFPLPVARTKAICVEPTLGEPPVSLLIISSAKSWAYLRTCKSPTTLLMTGGEEGLRSEEHTSELQSRLHLVCRLLLEKKKKKINLETFPAIISSI